MSSKKNKDELIIPTKEEIDKEFPKFDDSIYSTQAIIDMIDKHIAFNKKHGLSTDELYVAGITW